MPMPVQRRGPGGGMPPQAQVQAERPKGKDHLVPAWAQLYPAQHARYKVEFTWFPIDLDPPAGVSELRQHQQTGAFGLHCDGIRGPGNLVRRASILPDGRVGGLDPGARQRAQVLVQARFAEPAHQFEPSHFQVVLRCQVTHVQPAQQGRVRPVRGVVALRLPLSEGG